MNTYENEFYSQGYNAGVKIERVQKATRLFNRIKELESIVENQKVYIEREICTKNASLEEVFNEGYEAGVEAKTDDLENTIDKLNDEVFRLRNLLRIDRYRKDLNRCRPLTPLNLDI